MDYGVHLPLIDFGNTSFSLQFLTRYVETARQLNFQMVAANDHLVFARPWLDGLTALTVVLAQSGQMALMTSVALPVVRGPVPLAKTLAAIDLLSEGRLSVGVGPGSSPRDYAAVGLPFEERWKRLDEAIQALRALWQRDHSSFRGQYYNTEGIVLAPYPAQPAGPPLWLGSWGSEIGLRRTARLGDGWLASAYNITPAQFASAWKMLQEQLRQAGKDPDQFPNTIATMFLYLTEDSHQADQVIREVVSPTLNRSADQLQQRLLIGPVQECAEKLSAYRAAGVQRVLLWPITDELHQLELFKERVVPTV